MEYHSFLYNLVDRTLGFKDYARVSVSLRSIIHSYWTMENYGNLNFMGFRLLTEYYSFLFLRYLQQPQQKARVSVSLRSIIHSYDQKLVEQYKELESKFPSPYGVLFILIRN